MARVLLVGKGAPDRGGIAAFIGALLAADAAGCFEGRHQLDLLNLTRDELPRSGRLTTANVRRTLADSRALWRAAPDADVVHIHTALVPLVTLVRTGALVAVGRLRRRPVVVHAHSGKVERWLTTRWRRLAARTLMAPASAVVAVSRGGQDALAAAGVRDPILVDNGVDCARFGPPGGPHDPPRVLFAGVLTPRKGILDLFAASQVLTDRDVDHELRLAGGTPDEGAEAETAVRSAAPSRARFLGPQPQEAMPDRYREADIFCLPSWWEAMPLSVLEASASGLPVVATRVGDIERAVVDGASGTLVAPQSPTDLADALERYLTSPEERRAAGTAGRHHVSVNFDARATWRALSDIYDRQAEVAVGSPRRERRKGLV